MILSLGRLAWGGLLASLAVMPGVGWQDDEPQEQQPAERMQLPFDIRDEAPLMGELPRALRGLRMNVDGAGVQSIRVSEANGVREVRIKQNGEQYVIKTSDQQVSVTYGKSYGPEDLDQLKQEYPDLAMHVAAFPEQSGGADVELTVRMRRTVEAENAEELQQKDPEAFEIYQKYQNPSGPGAWQIFGEDGGPLELKIEGGRLPRGLPPQMLPRLRFSPRDGKLEL